MSDRPALHVRHVVRQFHPAIGGLEDAVANLAVSLRACGIDGSVVTLDRRFVARDVPLPAADRYRGIPVTRIPFRGSRRYPLAPAVLGTLGGADLVHVHGVDFFFDFLAVTKLVHRRPLVASTHGGFFHTQFASRLKTAYFNSATRASAMAYARIFGSSESDAAMFATIAPARTMTIENGVDIGKWHDAASPALVPVMIFVGRFSVNKRIPDLIALVAATAAAGVPFRLIVAGQEDDLSADALRAAAARLGVAAAVEIHVGASDAGVRALAGRASYVASASRYEGFGLSVVEGLSAGLTPILSPIPPFARLIRAAGRGALLDMTVPAAAAAMLIDAHAALAAAYPAARAANIAAAARFAWPDVAQRFAAEYRAVLGAYAGRKGSGMAPA